MRPDDDDDETPPGDAAAAPDGEDSRTPPGNGDSERMRPAARRDGFFHRLEKRPGLAALATLAALAIGILAAVPDWREMVTPS